MIVSNRKLKFPLILASVFYILVFVLLDKYGVLHKIRLLNYIDFIILVALFIMSIFFRYTRWYFLLKCQGVDSDFFSGFLRYSAGFLYTATPGKVGELSRIYYYSDTSVNKVNIVSSFIIERTFDLAVVLLLSSFILIGDSSFEYIIVAVLFILLMIIICSFFSFYIKEYIKLDYRIVNFLIDVLISIRENITLKIFIISSFLGLVAWSITSYILIYILSNLGLMVNFSYGLISIYPISMLAGALTFIPGGIGTTEATIAYTLNYFDISMENAFLVAVLARFCTLWFATILGFICSWCLSLKKNEI